MTKKKKGQAQADATKKEQRARETTKAMLEHEDEARAIRERTARLRELRLAKQAAEKREEVAALPDKGASQRRTFRSIH